MLSEPPPTVRHVSQTRRRAAPRGWRYRLREAFRGMKVGMRGHSSFSVFLFAAALAVAACVALDCRLVEWCLILLCIGFVLTAELFSTAIETLARGQDVDPHSPRNRSLGIAAGAVFLASVFAASVGGMVFVNRFGELLRWWD